MSVIVSFRDRDYLRNKRIALLYLVSLYVNYMHLNTWLRNQRPFELLIKYSGNFIVIEDGCCLYFISRLTSRVNKLLTIIDILKSIKCDHFPRI